MPRLSLKTVSGLRDGCRRPNYDIARIQSGIVHLGIGAFHRAHQALYTDDILATDNRWGIVGVSLRGLSVSESLNPQDGLYSLIERHGEKIDTRVIGAVRKVIPALKALDAVIAHIADPSVHVVTTTVTEKGYSQHPATGDLNLDDPDIQHDLANPEQPRSTLGVLTAGLRRRPVSAPMTIVCCDNMVANGATVRRLLCQFAERIDKALARHIENAVAFPNSMVDRIVPAATPESLAFAEAQLGLRDEAAIVCEPFKQWVVEDRFAGPRPPWENAGVLLTDDVRPFQALKLRLLNGTHSAIAYLGQLLGIETVADVMTDKRLSLFVRRLMLDDLRATVKAPAGYNVPAYCAELLDRFENPSLQHRTEQIAMDGTQKVPVRWLPALRESAAADVARPYLERAVAAWLHYLVEGKNETGRALVIGDPGAPALAERLRKAGADPRAVTSAAFSYTSVFGDAAWPSKLQARIADHLATLRAGGVAALTNINKSELTEMAT